MEKLEKQNEELKAMINDYETILEEQKDRIKELESYISDAQYCLNKM